MSQKDWAITQLRETGKVTRNDALRNYISRLGAIALVLKKEGWNLTAKKEGRDYVYRVEKSVRQITRDWNENDRYKIRQIAQKTLLEIKPRQII